MSVSPHAPAPAAAPPAAGLLERVRASALHSARAFGLVWRSSPAGVVTLAALTVGVAALPPFVAWVGKLIIDSIIAAGRAPPGPARVAELAQALRWVGVELAAVLVQAGTERVL